MRQHVGDCGCAGLLVLGTGTLGLDDLGLGLLRQGRRLCLWQVSMRYGKHFAFIGGFWATKWFFGGVNVTLIHNQGALV